VVVVVHLNGHPTWALIDTGSLANFMSSTLADQLKVKKIPLDKPLTIQLAIQGSRLKVNFGTKVHFSYQNVREERFFDIINLQNYDLILGTPFIFQHQVMVGLNLARVVVGSDQALPVHGEHISILESQMVKAQEENLEQTREELRQLAKPLCAKASETGLLLKTMARGCIQSLGGVSMTDSEGLWPQLICCAPHLSMVPLISDKVQ